MCITPHGLIKQVCPALMINYVLYSQDPDSYFYAFHTHDLEGFTNDLVGDIWGEAMFFFLNGRIISVIDSTEEK